jgi:hypothetical protein
MRAFESSLLVGAQVGLVDGRAPRFNQAVVAVGSALAVATGAWGLLALLALQLSVTLVLGPRFCLACLVYFRFVRPHWGSGPLEDARAPRFANLIGSLFLWSASAAFAIGFRTTGTILASVVAVLAALAAGTGFCAGCEVYKRLARLRGIRGGSIEQIDLSASGSPAASGAVVLFVHPLCSACHELSQRLKTTSASPLVTIDVSQRKDLAQKYGVAVVPLAVRVDAAGRVVERIQ